MKSKTKTNLRSQIIDWIKFGILLLVIFVAVTNSIGFTRVLGHFMDPTLKDGSWIAVNKLSTHFRKPKFGDVAIIHQDEKGYDIIKRIIGLPGDTVAIREGTVYVNDLPLPEIYTFGRSYDMEEVIIEEDHIFIIGDNRTPGESLDSRDPSIGPLPISSVEGYAAISLIPLYPIMKPLKI